MFTLLNPTKTPDLSGYFVDSLPCPTCQETVSVRIDSYKLFAYNQGASALEVLEGYDANTRERFMSGLCGECWADLFSYNEDED